jgi:hypothetical protein
VRSHTRTLPYRHRSFFIKENLTEIQFFFHRPDFFIRAEGVVDYFAVFCPHHTNSAAPTGRIRRTVTDPAPKTSSIPAR